MTAFIRTPRVHHAARRRGGGRVAVAARAQQTMPVIGFLNSTSPDADRVRAFLQGLNDIGYVEGENVAVEYRWAENRPDRLSPKCRPDRSDRGCPSCMAAQAATRTIPIVFGVGECAARCTSARSWSSPWERAGATSPAAWSPGRW